MKINEDLYEILESKECIQAYNNNVNTLSNFIPNWFIDKYNIHIEFHYNMLYKGYELYVKSKSGIRQYYDDLGDSVFNDRESLIEIGINMALEILNEDEDYGNKK